MENEDYLGEVELKLEEIPFKVKHCSLKYVGDRLVPCDCCIKISEENIVELHKFLTASKLTGYLPDELIETIKELLKYYLIRTAAN